MTTAITSHHLLLLLHTPPRAGEKFGVTSWGALNGDAIEAGHEDDEGYVQAINLPFNVLDGYFHNWSKCDQMRKLVYLDLRSCLLRGSVPLQMAYLVISWKPVFGGVAPRSSHVLCRE